LSSASIVGAIAAIAEPPHMPVPAEMRFDSFQLSPSALPMKYPPPKQVRSVNAITANDILPTFRTVVILSDKPSKIIASFESFLDVNFNPEDKNKVFFRKVFKIMPINIAITAAPIKWIGKMLSINVATAAIITDKATPGKSFAVLIKYFFINPPASVKNQLF
jgi:hypothetical protein